MNSQERAAISVRLAMGKLTKGDAEELLHYCRNIAGWYPMSSLCAEDVVTHWQRTRSDIPKLAVYADTAAEYIARKWEGGDDLFIAWDMACDMIEEDARKDGHIWTDTTGVNDEHDTQGDGTAHQ